MRLSRGQNSGRVLAAALLLATGTAAFSHASSETAPALADAIKATFVSKFAPFVEWPAAAGHNSPTICIVGRDSVSALIEQAQSGGEPGAAMAARRVAAPVTDGACPILYVANTDPELAAAALASVKHAPVLTITDASAGAPHGIINFVMVGNHVRFDIDDRLASENGLVISSKMLSLARNVVPPERSP